MTPLSDNPYDWTPASRPEFLNPLIGYLYWRMQFGEDLVSATVRMQGLEKFSGLNQAEYAAAARIADQEFRLSQRARQALEGGTPTTVGATYGINTTVGPVVGLRVTVIMASATGNVQEVTVLVNASSDRSLSAVLQQAQQWVQANAAQIWGSAYAGMTAVESTVSQVSGSGWDNPAFFT